MPGREGALLLQARAIAAKPHSGETASAEPTPLVLLIGRVHGERDGAEALFVAQTLTANGMRVEIAGDAGAAMEALLHLPVLPAVVIVEAQPSRPVADGQLTAPTEGMNWGPI